MREHRNFRKPLSKAGSSHDTEPRILYSSLGRHCKDMTLAPEVAVESVRWRLWGVLRWMNDEY